MGEGAQNSESYLMAHNLYNTTGRTGRMKDARMWTLASLVDRGGGGSRRSGAPPPPMKILDPPLPICTPYRYFTWWILMSYHCELCMTSGCLSSILISSHMIIITPSSLIRLYYSTYYRSLWTYMHRSHRYVQQSRKSHVRTHVSPRGTSIITWQLTAYPN